MSIINLILLLLISPIFLVSCTPIGKQFATEACVKENLNCTNPTTIIDLLGGDESKSSISINGTGDDAGAVKIKKIRYGENTIIEFLITNPRLIPLKDFLFSMSENNPAFSLVNSVSYDSCANNILLYNEKCSVAVKYSPGRIPPDKIDLQFSFKTLIGNNFIFVSAFDPSVLLADFYIDAADLLLPSTLVYSSNSTATEIQTSDIRIENTSSKTDDNLTIAALKMDENGPCFLIPPSSNSCSVGTMLEYQARNSCNVKIGYKPKSLGLNQCLLEIISTNGIYRTYSFAGETIGLVNSEPAFDFGILRTTANPVTKSMTFSLGADSSSTPASHCSLTLNPADPALAVTSNPVIPDSITSNSVFNVSIEYTPQNSTKTSSSTLVLDCDSRGNKIEIPINAATTEGILSSNFGFINFNNTPLGSSSTQTLEIKNNSVTQTVTEIASSIGSGSSSSFSIENSNCGSSLGPLQTCQITVKYTPASTATDQDNFTFIGSQAELTPTLSLKGNGLGLVSSLDSFDFGTLKPKTDRPGPSIYITNKSSVGLTDCAISSTELINSGFTVDENSTCLDSTNLSAGASCTIKPRFTAGTIPGIKQTTLSYKCNQGGTISIPLRAEVSPYFNLVLAPPRIVEWDDRLVGVNETHTFSFINQDASDLLNFSITENNLNSPWSKISTTCTSTLPQGESCLYHLRYNPSATPGAEQTGATWGSLLGEGTDTEIITASFSAIAKKITANAASMDLGRIFVNSSRIGKYRIFFSNPSLTTTASGCSLSSLTQFQVAETSCRSSLSPGGICSALIKLDAPSNPQIFSEDLHYTCDIGGRATVNLQAQVITPLANISSLDFGEWDIDKGALLKTLTVTNTSSENLSLGVPSIPNSSVFSVSSTTCGNQLARAATCDIVVAFDPSASGWNTGFISMHFDSGLESATYSAQLNGIGTFMNLTLSLNSLSFNHMRIGSADSEILTVTVTNHGDRVANLSFDPLSSPWSYDSDGTCTSTLAVNSPCTLKIKATAHSSSGNHSGVLNINETLLGHSVSYPITLSGSTWDNALIAIRDNRAQTSFIVTDISETNVTGLPDDNTNIVNLSPAIQFATFTIKNNRILAYALQNLAVSFTNVSGPHHMSIFSDDCTSKTLQANEECSITISYSPQAVREDMTVYRLSVSGTDNGVTSTISSNSVKGNSFKGVELTENYTATVHDFGFINASTSVTDTTTITLTNIGDVSATHLSFLFSGPFSPFTINDKSCGSSLAGGGGTCTFKLGFTPNNTALAMRSSLSISSDQETLSNITEVLGASYFDNQGGGSPGAGVQYLEHEITSDSSHFFVSSKKTTATSSNLHLEICDKNSLTGNIDISTCGTNDLIVPGEAFWAGAFVGYKLNPISTDNKIIISSSNQLADKDNNKGISSVLICNKSGINGSNTINFNTDCSVFNLHDRSLGLSEISNDDGAFTSLVIKNNKAVFSSQNTNGFTLTVCNFDDSKIPNEAISNCQAQQVTLTDMAAEYTDVDYDGTQVVMAAHSNTNLNPGLFAVACSMDGVNNLTCGDYTLIDNSFINDGSLPTPNLMYAGAHPYLVIDTAGILIASQQGSKMSQGLRLARCSLSGLSFTCINKTVAQATDAAGFGLNPSIKVIQRGPSRIAWIQSVLFDDYMSPSTAIKKIGIYSCDITNFSNTCSNIYYQQSNTSGSPIYAREMDLDLTRKIITIPFTNSVNGSGVLTLGLHPDL